MNSTYSIRHAEARDAGRIAVLGAQVWMHTYATSGVSNEIAQYILATFTPDRMLALVRESGVVILIAEEEGRLAAYLVLRFNSRFAKVSTEIETLYVQHAFARRGIGSALLARARRVAMAETGSHAVWLTVNAQNQRAISFYQSQGMTEDGITYFELGGVKHENKVMVVRD